jgi:hypothetical protein
MTALKRRLRRLEATRSLTRRLELLERKSPIQRCVHHVVFGDDPLPADLGLNDTVHRVRLVGPEQSVVPSQQPSE